MEFGSGETVWRMGWGVAGVLLLLWAWRGLEWLWWRPRRLERALRAQGLAGTRYRFYYGDLKEDAQLIKEARTKHMPFSHDIVPRVAPYLHRLMKENGKIFITWFGPVPKVTIMNPESFREVLSNKSTHFVKQNMSPLFRPLATGVVSYDGEKWAKHRRILNPAFHVEKLKRMLPAFSACCSKLVDRWEKSISSLGYYEFDVLPELQNFTRDTISRTAFGRSYEEGRQIFHLLAEQVEIINQVSHSMNIPGYRFLPTPMNNRRKEIEREIGALLRGMIEKRERAIKMGEASNDDLLGFMMESNLKHFQEHGNSKNARMTTDEAIEESKLFYFAGYETTSVLLTWTMVVLSMHPSWQLRARKEVLELFGKNKPDFDGLNRLNIVTMILYEVLRLYPPVTLITRRTCKTMKLGDVTYPAGVVLAFPVIFIHHDAELWGKDASEFNPERFAEGVSKASGDQVAFFPFGWGPRTCIGQSFALLEAKMGLSMILQLFSFELSPTYVHSPHTIVTLQPQHGAPIRLHRV